ncbi:uncharacterized protein N7483_012224 [Penicillium malachiteum]|uniref:uncharacterized protein n=1 Tax=Penicillium malachiteum TaxID=1324776 RepID=UPI002546F384|nr:uncharacterized protein N7483_012224 [Penicillium malachiteum]KAJ5715043.1 hypothetical protein N7483_012224 [Penicillium malachiteum]
MASGESSELPRLVTIIKTLTIPQLKDLLRNEGLPVSGLKAALQVRIIDCLSFPHPFSVARSPQPYLARTWMSSLRTSVFVSQMATMSGSTPSAGVFYRRIYLDRQSSRRTQAPPYQHAPAAQQTPSQPRSTLGNSMSPHPHTSGAIIFKDSPFFTILAPLTPVVECKIREQTRDSVELKVFLSQTHVAELEKDPNLRVMVYCTADSGLKQFTKSDIAFPHQVELKANLDEVKANLRGLKNKPGTTQPADVSNYLRRKVNYPNNIVMTYALTQKKFFVLANMVKQHPVEELVAQLKSRKLISKEQVLREMKNRAEDSDIVATSSIMSLKCPLSTLRIQVPCRSVVCTHNQCFDASSFLQLQKQAPTWTCPVCAKATSFESLQVDQYVDEILKSTESDVDQVVVEPNGDWSQPDNSNAAKLAGTTPTTDDDDLIEISEPSLGTVKQEPITSNILLERTPAQSRETSTPSSAVRMSSKKRPAPVIDLTASDDEDDINESPGPPLKRPILNFGRGPSSQDLHQPPASSPLNGRPYPPSL